MSQYNSKPTCVDFPGVYSITNVLNGKRYIGSSSRGIWFRWLQHRAMLKKGKHHAKHLQNSWDTYGEEKFRIECLEIASPQDFRIFQIETKHIEFHKTYSPKFGYNEKKNATSPSAEMREKIRRSLTGIKHSEERRKNSSIAHKGKPWSEFRRNKYNSKTYLLSFEDGKTEIVSNLTQYCKDRGFNLEVVLRAKRSGKYYKSRKSHDRFIIQCFDNQY